MATRTFTVLLSLESLAVLASILANGAPTTEIDMNATSRSEPPSQEDVDQFYKDQSHLVPYTNESTNQIGWLSSSNGFGQFGGINIDKLTWFLTQIGVPVIIQADFQSYSIVFIAGPIDVLTQFINTNTRQLYL